MAEFGSDLLDQQVYGAEAALAPHGVLNEIALAMTNGAHGISAEEAADVLLPQKGAGAEKPRWELAEQAGERKKALITEHADAILEMAGVTGLRQEETLSAADIARFKAMDSENLTVVAEAGANGTFVARPYILRHGMKKAGVTTTIFQPVTNRPITATRKDGTPNPEHGIVQSLVPNKEYLPAGDTSEHDVTHAVNRQLGFGQTDKRHIPGLGTFTTYERGAESRIVVSPESGNGARRAPQGFTDGLFAIQGFLHQTEGRVLDLDSIVIGTNGQYRTKDGLLVQKWALENTLPSGSPLVLGDEAGFVTPHMDNERVTANRAPVLYVHEAVVVARLARQIRSLREA